MEDILLEKIFKQMNNCICKIEIENMKGTGFFCKIPFPNLNNMIPVLITSNLIINKNSYNKEENIDIDIKNENNIIELNLNKRMKYSNEQYGITIIEIKENDGINNYLEIDDILINDIINNNKKNFEFFDDKIYFT